MALNNFEDEELFFNRTAKLIVINAVILVNQCFVTW